MATFVSPVTVSPMRNVLTLRSQNLNTVLTHVKGSVTIVVEDELESHEVLAGARRIGRALQPRSDRCLHSATAGGTVPLRSEEHTSELQSLMRNSYAVFCLKK